MANDNRTNGWGWLGLILMIGLIGAGFLYQQEGGRLFPPKKPAEEGASQTHQESADVKNIQLPTPEKPQETLTLNGHTAAVLDVAFSPDGKRLASASWDGTVKVWDAASGEEMLTFKSHVDHVTGVRFSSDGKRLASIDAYSVKLWDSTTGQESLTLKEQTTADANKEPRPTEETIAAESPGARLISMAFSLDGNRLAAISEYGDLMVWNATTGQQTHHRRYDPGVGGVGI